tara:strand:- start:589 stop:843 length:255 start_codon:yes stop_codon:yes gene_type:complete
MAEIGQFIFCNVALLVVYLLKSFFYFVTGDQTGATVTQLVIKLYNSMTYVVAPMCHYSRQRKALFCFLENKMSKNSTILRVIAW